MMNIYQKPCDAKIMFVTGLILTVAGIVGHTLSRDFKAAAKPSAPQENTVRVDSTKTITVLKP